MKLWKILTLAVVLNAVPFGVFWVVKAAAQTRQCTTTYNPYNHTYTTTCL